jgi:hypothetical protein
MQPKYCEFIPDIIIDNLDNNVIITGNWYESTSDSDFYRDNYIHDGDELQGQKSVVFTPDIEESGEYFVFIKDTFHNNRATNVPINISHDDGVSTVYIDQSEEEYNWEPLGRYNFTNGGNGYVKISNDGADGYVIADAVKFKRNPEYTLIDNCQECGCPKKKYCDTQSGDCIPLSLITPDVFQEEIPPVGSDGEEMPIDDSSEDKKPKLMAPEKSFWQSIKEFFKFLF